jgi:hypothetical protein
MYMPDNILGPDPREDDPTLWEGTWWATVKVSRGITSSNRKVDEDDENELDKLQRLLENAGYSVEINQSEIDAN